VVVGRFRLRAAYGGNSVEMRNEDGYAALI
jgi:hypothetical protein